MRICRKMCIVVAFSVSSQFASARPRRPPDVCPNQESKDASGNCVQVATHTPVVINQENSTPPGPKGVNGVCRVSGIEQFRGNVTFAHCAALVFANGAQLIISGATSVRIDVPQIEVNGTARIIANGRPGRVGDRGPNNPREPWNSRGDDDYWSARADCTNNASHPDRGGRGGRGGDGEAGPNIFLLRGPVRGVLNVEARGGAGGSGGPGGSGRLLRNGRNFYCDGCMYNCPSGPSGENGSPGRDGDIYVGKSVFTGTVILVAPGTMTQKPSSAAKGRTD